MNRRRESRIALAAGLALVLAACGEAPQPPTAASAIAGGSDAGAALEGPRYRIAYNVLEDAEADDYEVYVMELDGSESRNLTEHPAVDWVYVGRSDRLYMVSDRDEEKRKYRLYEMDVATGGLRQITPFRVRDSWLAASADGSRLVVASAKDGSPDLYLIDGDGNELRRLTDDDTADRDPTFSPDGASVVWSSSRSGLDELWHMDLATGETARLTHFPEDDPARDEHGYHAGPPFWEHHSNRITFCSKRAGNYSIFSVRPDGSGLEQLTGDEFDECWHAWSPDGRYLAYDGTDADGNYDIYLRDTDSGETTRLTSHPRTEQAPVFVRASEATAGS